MRLMNEIEEKALENTRVQEKMVQIARLRVKATFFWPYIGIAILFGAVGILGFVARSIPGGIIGVLVACAFVLLALKASDASDALEEMGATEEAQHAKSAGIKGVMVILILAVVLVGAGLYLSAQIDASREAQKAEAWDRLAISTATVALDQYAPDVDYGPLRTDGWTVIHNNDGTTTVWAPQTYGRIAIMMTNDGEYYTPYWISVNNTVVLDLKLP